VKLDALKISIGISLACHIAAIGVFRLYVSTHPPMLPSEAEAPLTLTLLAAPDEPVNSPAVIVQPQPPTPKLLPPVEPLAPSKPVEVVAPIKPLPTPVPIAEIKPTAPPPTQTLARGDASSPEPGPDPTTQKKTISILAAPDYRKNPEPDYPPLARRRHQQGLVTLAVKVNTQGRVAEVKVKTSSGFPILDEAALQAVRAWEFQPARIGLMAVESEIEVPVRFRLTD
jgi:protein TonB